MSHLIARLFKLGLFSEDYDYHLIRKAMVVVFFFFGYQKLFEYGARVLVPFISNGPLTSWLYPAFGFRGASFSLEVAEWAFGILLLLGFWNKALDVLGELDSCATFAATVTIIPFIPGGWAESAGGFPAMAGPVACLMKDGALLAASFYLLKQDVIRVAAYGKAFPFSTRRCRNRITPG
ncbi:MULTISPECIES: YkgB family protein [Bradyrhizobium]|uniref:YkgB family protein n=1 Tax=Bradyrhizobium elkanii TaxID=29448 RepID=UPI0003F88C1E|nr:DUF417 family protein [Bradyrhizobium elkanii]